MTSPILRNAYARLRDESPKTLEAASPRRITANDRTLLVELEAEGADGADGAVGADATHANAGHLAGVAHRPRGSPRPPAADRDLEALLAPISGRDSDATPAGDETDPRLDRAVAIATLNALSAPAIDWDRGDPMGLLEPSVERIVTVGLFRPAFRRFSDVEVRVLERASVDLDPDDVPTPADVRLSTYTPDETAVAMEGADVVFVTGSAFVYGGADRYLRAIPRSAAAVVIGATASFRPEPLFEAGVDVVAGASVAEPDRVRRAVKAGACGNHLHDAGLRKGYVVRGRESPAGLRLDDSSDAERADGG
ncbi:hypothetical protein CHINAEXTREME_02220 [Halobiforma lacisalsi AJ5]|uniref:Putative heavy-metal chelation domain-containing protein n=1 Tax=Natronobacterium lacisalsi AJ5 TaxID=358396 RepID=M0LG59_NATLA|nr:DUF364 domain-containing protein [Halobiforma lacisalsi]APW96659.1 hypothetical protein CHINAEXTREME_02220 [Halobiforma lacisalsi AJ5]EMA32058.1 hypothetical protein C445_12126 [Halobiforma lacisalsi AJ5]